MVHNVESSSFRLAYVEVPNDDTEAFRMARPVNGDASQPFAEVPQAHARLKVHIGFTSAISSVRILMTWSRSFWVVS